MPVPRRMDTVVVMRDFFFVLYFFERPINIYIYMLKITVEIGSTYKDKEEIRKNMYKYI